MAAPPAPPAPPTAAVPPNTTTATSASSSLRASEPAPTAVYPRGVAPSPGAGAAPPTTSSASGGGGGVTIGDYVLTELIGTGSFAAVYKGYHVRDGGAVAVKAIPLARLEGGGGDGAAAALRGLETEIRLLRAIAHDNIVRLLDVQRSARYIFLVLEYCDGGDVARYLRLHGPLGEAGARHVLRQLAAGLSALWERHLIHRDIKPSNLLLATRGALDGGASPPPAVKLADFGFARHLEASALAETLCGSPLYMSPELLRMQPYDAKADLWSVGILLAEVLTGRPPFWGRTPLELLHVIERSAWAAAVSPPVGPDAATCGGILPPAVAAAVSPACKDLLWRLLRRNPVTRISFDAFFAHPWLQDGDSPGRPLGPAGGEAVAAPVGDGRRSAMPIGQLPTTAADSFERRSGGGGSSGLASPARRLPPPLPLPPRIASTPSRLSALGSGGDTSDSGVATPARPLRATSDDLADFVVVDDADFREADLRGGGATTSGGGGGGAQDAVEGLFPDARTALVAATTQALAGAALASRAGRALAAASRPSLDLTLAAALAAAEGIDGGGAPSHHRPAPLPPAMAALLPWAAATQLPPPAAATTPNDDGAGVGDVESSTVSAPGAPICSTAQPPLQALEAAARAARAACARSAADLAEQAALALRGAEAAAEFAAGAAPSSDGKEWAEWCVASGATCRATAAAARSLLPLHAS